METRQTESDVDAHNTFDQLNRAAIINGEEPLVNGQKTIVASIKGHLIQYDYADWRTHDTNTYRHANVNAGPNRE